MSAIEVRAVDELIEGPVVGRHPHDRAVQQAPLLEAVQRPEGHHLGEVTGDAEDHERVTGLVCVGHGAQYVASPHDEAGVRAAGYAVRP